jgi:hypothetical protein
MAEDSTDLGQVIRIDDNVVRGSVEETLNAMLGAESERLCTAGRTKKLTIAGCIFSVISSGSHKHGTRR